MLVPAGFLVLMLLAALAVDSAVAYQAQNQLHDALSAAANDAVSAGFDSRAFYGQGRVQLDETDVATVVCRSIAAQGLTQFHGLQVGIAVSADSVRVSGRATVDAVFGRVVPGYGRRTVSSDADAVLSGGAPGKAPSFGPAVPLSCRV